MFLREEWKIWRPGQWPSRLEATRLLLMLGLLLGVLVSWRLWLTDRVFPHLTCFDWLGPFPQPWDKILFGVYLLVITACLFQPKRRWVLGLLLGLSVLLALQDQVRWQPWFYLYLLGLAGFLHRSHGGWEGREHAVLGLLRFLFVAMYFWSGFHKLHPAFDNMFGQAFVGRLSETRMGWATDLLAQTQGAAPWVEMATALFLLLPVPIVRHLGVLMAVSTHLFILSLVGPFGLDENVVIWPWNVLMILLVPLVFWRISSFGWRDMAATPVKYCAVPLVVLVGIMPAFSPGIWDRYFSFHLYSGRDQRVILVLNERALGALPEKYHPFLVPGAGKNIHELRFKEWALAELKVPMPTEERHNLRLSKQLADLPYPPGSFVRFYFDYEFELEVRGYKMITVEEMKRLERFPEPDTQVRKK